MSGGASPGRKGSRLERLIVTTLRKHGFSARRMPLSGAVSGFEGDVQACIGGRQITLECKARADGFRQLYGWLQDRDGLILKADRQPPLAVLRLADLLSILEVDHA